MKSAQEQLAASLDDLDVAADVPCLDSSCTYEDSGQDGIAGLGAGVDLLDTNVDT